MPSGSRQASAKAPLTDQLAVGEQGLASRSTLVHARPAEPAGVAVGDDQLPGSWPQNLRSGTRPCVQTRDAHARRHAAIPPMRPTARRPTATRRSTAGPRMRAGATQLSERVGATVGIAAHPANELAVVATENRHPPPPPSPDSSRRLIARNSRFSTCSGRIAASSSMYRQPAQPRSARHPGSGELRTASAQAASNSPRNGPAWRGRRPTSVTLTCRRTSARSLASWWAS